MTATHPATTSAAAAAASSSFDVTLHANVDGDGDGGDGDGGDGNIVGNNEFSLVWTSLPSNNNVVGGDDTANNAAAASAWERRYWNMTGAQVCIVAYIVLSSSISSFHFLFVCIFPNLLEHDGRAVVYCCIYCNYTHMFLRFVLLLVHTPHRFATDGIGT
jgi:hypothetical protein